MTQWSLFVHLLRFMKSVDDIMNMMRCSKQSKVSVEEHYSETGPVLKTQTGERLTPVLPLRDSALLNVIILHSVLLLIINLMSWKCSLAVSYLNHLLFTAFVAHGPTFWKLVSAITCQMNFPSQTVSKFKQLITCIYYVPLWIKYCLSLCEMQ